MVKSRSVNRRLTKIEHTLKEEKPEVKTLDVLLNPLPATGLQFVYSGGISNGIALTNYDLTRGFLQGLQNDDGNIDGNYCKLTSMDLRILLKNQDPSPWPPVGANTTPTRQVRLMIVRIPDASIITPADVQSQVLAYGTPAIYGSLVNVSPLKRNSNINGGYDVMYDRVHILNNATINPNKSTALIHFRKKWSKGLTLRFSGNAGALTLEQNRIYLFAMDYNNVFPAPPGVPNQLVSISFINRLRYSDQ